jgi:hypothetical protein
MNLPFGVSFVILKAPRTAATFFTLPQPITTLIVTSTPILPVSGHPQLLMSLLPSNPELDTLSLLPLAPSFGHRNSKQK